MSERYAYELEIDIFKNNLRNYGKLKEKLQRLKLDIEVLENNMYGIKTTSIIKMATGSTNPQSKINAKYGQLKKYDALNTEKAYYRFRELREKDDLCTCIIDCVRIQLALARTESQKERVVCSFVGMMNDISYQRGVRLDSVIRFSRDELFRLFKYEIELTRQVGQQL